MVDVVFQASHARGKYFKNSFRRGGIQVQVFRSNRLLRSDNDEFFGFADPHPYIKSFIGFVEYLHIGLGGSAEFVAENFVAPQGLRVFGRIKKVLIVFGPNRRAGGIGNFIG